MAKEQVISIKTGEAVQNLNQLKETIKAYKDELGGLKLGSDEYKETLKDLENAQALLRNAMHGTAASFNDLQKAATATNLAFDQNDKLVKADTYSYNALVRQLAALKEQWRATDNAADRLKIGRQINSVNDQLKALDASVGVFGRNVGNYVGSLEQFSKGFASMGRGAAGVINPLRNMTMGFKTLSATPAIAILGLLANLLTKVTGALKSSEENTQGLAQAMAPLQTIGDAVTKVLQGLGQAVVWLVDQFGKLTQTIFGTNKAMEERTALAEKEIALTQQQRRNLIENAEAERDIAELRAKSTDKLNYSASERLAFLREAGEKEKEIAARAYEDAKLAYEVQKAKNALTQSSKEAKDAEAQAYAAMVKAETDYYNRVRTINAGITKASREEMKAARDAAKAKKDAATAKLQAEKDYLTQLLSVTRKDGDEALALQNEIARKEFEIAEANARQKITDKKALDKTLLVLQKEYDLKVQKNAQDHADKVTAAEALAMQNRRDTFQKGSVEYLAAERELAAHSLDNLRKRMDETDEEFKARTLAAQRKLAEAGVNLAAAVAKETEEGIAAELAAVREGSVEALELSLEMARAKVEGLVQGVDESLDAFNARRLAAEKAVRKAEDALEEGRVERDRLVQENRMNTLKEGSLAYLAEAVALKQYELDTLHRLEDESEDQFQARRLAKMREVEHAEKAHYSALLSMAQSYAGGLTSIMGSIADMLESGTDVSAVEAQRAKNLRIASATIDTISGAIAAYMNTIKSVPDPVTGNILAAVQAAAVTAAGMANIAKIKATQINKDSASASPAVVSPAQVPAPVYNTTFTQVRTLTGASEEERLNQPQQVYILSSDLEADRNARKVQVQETTF